VLLGKRAWIGIAIGIGAAVITVFGALKELLCG